MIPLPEGVRAVNKQGCSKFQIESSVTELLIRPILYYSGYNRIYCRACCKTNDSIENIVRVK